MKDERALTMSAGGMMAGTQWPDMAPQHPPPLGDGTPRSRVTFAGAGRGVIAANRFIPTAGPGDPPPPGAGPSLDGGGDLPPPPAEPTLPGSGAWGRASFQHTGAMAGAARGFSTMGGTPPEEMPPLAEMYDPPPPGGAPEPQQQHLSFHGAAALGTAAATMWPHPGPVGPPPGAPPPGPPDDPNHRMTFHSALSAAGIVSSLANHNQQHGQPANMLSDIPPPALPPPGGLPPPSYDNLPLGMPPPPDQATHPDVGTLPEGPQILDIIQPDGGCKLDLIMEVPEGALVNGSLERIELERSFKRSVSMRFGLNPEDVIIHSIEG